MKKILLIGGCGYVGSFLREHLTQDGFDVDVCDSMMRGNPAGEPLFPLDYAQLSIRDLREYGHVLWFAGHSSVASANQDPQGALRNNCLNLFELAQKLAPGARLVYASTASLYSRPVGESRPGRENDSIAPCDGAYDISKFAFDYIARQFVSRFVGLRMGTVCGHSPNLREDLVFNRMNLTALREGHVEVSNQQSLRGLLFLDDLLQCVRRCLSPQGANIHGFLNLASIHCRIGELAQRIARWHGVPVVKRDDSTTYSFMLDTSKARTELCMEFDHDLEDQCERFRAAETFSRFTQDPPDTTRPQPSVETMGT